MKESQSETLYSEEMRRCKVVDVCREGGRLRKYGHVIRRDERKSVRDIM
jgi:hypothetical protein